MPEVLPTLPTLSDHLTRGLCCAALNASLGSVLVFDLQPDQLPVVADAFAQMIAVARDEKVTRVVLNTVESEDSLWGSFGLSTRDARRPLIWQPGLLSPVAKEEGARLVVIPDLERVGPTVARALVAMVGADVAQVERYGRQQQWRPKFYWLAGCPGNATGRISLHLLDRFALRLEARSPRQRARAEDVLSWLNQIDRDQAPAEIVLPETLSQQLRQAAPTWPKVSDAAFERVLEYDTASFNASPRRGFALARLGHTLARLAAADEVSDLHIDQAAQFIGLSAPARDHQTDKPSVTPESSAGSEAKPATSAEEQVTPEIPIATPSTERAIADDQEIPSKSVEQAVTSSPATELPAASLAAPLDPYREDKQPAEREAASLRLPFQHSRQSAATRGIILGTGPARSLHDLALVSTLFEAVKFQFIRRQNSEASTDRVLIAPSDLRGYRRAPIPEQLLVLLLDYTCLTGRRWLESLLPFFKQAYVDRARICLIQVGAATAGHLLRADRQFFNSVLVPGLAAALEAPAGKATPLAHGLELALQTLRHALQHGRQIAHSARLVVISDGRGNVPLTFSVTGRIEHPVGREGIEDALHTAHKLRALDRVEISFLDPRPSSHEGLVSDLADALGAAPREIPLLEMELLNA
jgi:magnesium chelatase subunit D